MAADVNSVIETIKGILERPPPEVTECELWALLIEIEELHAALLRLDLSDVPHCDHS